MPLRDRPLRAILPARSRFSSLIQYKSMGYVVFSAEGFRRGTPLRWAPITLALLLLSAPNAEAEEIKGSSDPEVFEPDPALPERYFEDRYSLQPGRLRLGAFTPYAPRFGRIFGPSFDEAVGDALKFTGDEDSLAVLDWTQPILNTEYSGTALYQGAHATLDGDVTFELDGAQVQADHVEYDLDTGEVVLEGNVVITRETAELKADRLRFFRPQMPPPGTPAPLVPASGAVELNHPLVPGGYQGERDLIPTGTGVIEATVIDLDEPGRVLTADDMRYSLWRQEGEILNAHGHTGPLYFGIEELRVLGPADGEGNEVWVTTCDLPNPHYRFKMKKTELRDGSVFIGTNARLQLGRVATPLFLPKITTSLAGGERRLSTELDLGGRADLGFFIDVAQWFRVTDNINLAPRIYATTREGIGYGLDGEYNYMDNPTSPLFRGHGSFHTLVTTKGRGYTEIYHRRQVSENIEILGQWEDWSDADFVKDFYNSEFENRTGPRSFFNATRTRPTSITAVTVAGSTNSFTTETEKLPELTLNMLERPLGAGFYGTLDSGVGLYRTEPGELESFRGITVARLSYDWNIKRGLNVVPFIEADGTWYSSSLPYRESDVRGTATAGATAQARYQRAYRGRFGFTGFKHIVVPSVTFSYRPDATLDPTDTPRFDDLDDRPGRMRVESTVDHVLLGRNAASGKTWRVARATVYQGTDLSNENAESRDYEVEFEVRPRPWWGLQTVGEVYAIDSAPIDGTDDFNRAMAFVFYDNKFSKNTFNTRVGFARTDSGSTINKEEVIYGFGYKLTNKLSFGMQQRYDLNRNELSRQTYEIRRKMHKWEFKLAIRDRESGVDFGFQINLTDFPGTKFGF